MTSAPRSGRRMATVLTSIGLAALVASGSVLAGTPVTVGYRDHAYGGGAARPSSDKPQSKLWYTDGSWFAGMFNWRTTSPVKSEYQIYRLSADKTTFTSQNIRIDTRDTSHADYLWHEGTQTLWVASVLPPNTSDPLTAAGDGINIYKFTYNPVANTYSPTIGVPVAIPGTQTDVAGAFRGGAWTVTIDRDSTGRLWAAWPKVNDVLYSYSDDGGTTWTNPAQVPVQAGNPIHTGTLSQSDSAAVLAFGNGSPDTVGIMWSDQDDTPLPADNGYWFATIAAGADPTVGGNWTLEDMPPIAGTMNDSADNHINMKASSDGSVYMVGKARTDTIACATNQQRPLIPFYVRTSGGSWSAHLAGTVGDCNTRPQLVISEELDVAYLFMTSPNGGGTIYRKSAPLSGPEAFDFRGAADTTIQRGTPFIKSGTETLIDDPSTTKQVVTEASGIAVIANNLTSSAGGNAKVYLHNFMGIPATDTTDPTGTITLNGGAAVTSNVVVSAAVPGTDTGGSGVSLVRLSNLSNVDGSGVLNGAGSTSFVYTTPISWTVPGGDGDKTVYAQWRDAKGRWSAVANDTINLNTTDMTAPTLPGIPSHTLFGTGRLGIPVRVTWAASTDNAPVTYELQRSIDGGAFATVANPTTNGYSIDLSNSAHSYRFRVRAFDGVNYSAYRTGPTFKAISYSESSTAVKYSGTWGLSTSTVYVGGKARIGSIAGRSASLTFVGNRVGWLSRLGSTSGIARVYINGVLVKTINLNSATTEDRKLVFVRTFSTIGTRTIKIVVAGTAGHPRVTLDQIFVLR